MKLEQLTRDKIRSVFRKLMKEYDIKITSKEVQAMSKKLLIQKIYDFTVEKNLKINELEKNVKIEPIIKPIVQKIFKNPEKKKRKAKEEFNFEPFSSYYMPKEGTIFYNLIKVLDHGATKEQIMNTINTKGIKKKPSAMASYLFNLRRFYGFGIRTEVQKGQENKYFLVSPAIKRDRITKEKKKNKPVVQFEQ